MRDDESFKTETQIKIDELIKAIHELANVFKPIIENLAKAFNSFFPLCKEAFDVVGQIEEKRQKKKRYKLDFSRPRIQHQVIDRRPKLIRKVIR